MCKIISFNTAVFSFLYLESNQKEKRILLKIQFFIGTEIRPVLFGFLQSQRVQGGLTFNVQN